MPRDGEEVITRVLLFHLFGSPGPEFNGVIVGSVYVLFYDHREVGHRRLFDVFFQFHPIVRCLVSLERGALCGHLIGRIQVTKAAGGTLRRQFNDHRI